MQFMHRKYFQLECWCPFSPFSCAPWIRNFGRFRWLRKRFMELLALWSGFLNPIWLTQVPKFKFLWSALSQNWDSTNYSSYSSTHVSNPLTVSYCASWEYSNRLRGNWASFDREFSSRAFEPSLSVCASKGAPWGAFSVGGFRIM